MPVVLYARVSTSQQEQTDTIESHLEALHAYVTAHAHTVLPQERWCRVIGMGNPFGMLLTASCEPRCKGGAPHTNAVRLSTARAAADSGAAQLAGH
jgi:hypothetical protein